MATNVSQLMTVEEFQKLPKDDGPVYHELHHGELVEVTRPKLKHTLIQRNLRRLLEKVAPRASFGEIELAFRALPEYELRVADVAYISPEHWKKVNREDHFAAFRIW